MGRSQVNWKFWSKNNKNEIEFSMDSDIIPISTLFRWYCYDTGVGNPNQFSKDFGINPISAEGEEMEKRDSVARMENIIPYVDFLNVIADINAAVLMQTLSNVLKKHGLLSDDPMSKDEHDLTEDMYKHVSFGALLSAFSSGLSLGIIANPGAFVGEIGPDELS